MDVTQTRPGLFKFLLSPIILCSLDSMGWFLVENMTLPNFSKFSIASLADEFPCTHLLMTPSPKPVLRIRPPLEFINIIKVRSISQNE